MKWKINMVLIVLGIFITNNILSQSHTLDISTGCRLAKPVKGSARNYGKNCPACVKENEAETKAKKEEDARIDQQNLERDKKLKLEREKALAEQNKKIADEKEVQKKNELLITQNKTIIESNNQSEEPINKDYEKEFMYTMEGGYRGNNIHSIIYHNDRDGYSNKGFIHNGDTIFKNSYKACFGKHWSDEIEDETKFPKNVGIVILKEKYTYEYTSHTGKFCTKELLICDLINSKGERYFNDSTISAIIHLYDNYFLIARGDQFDGDHYSSFNSAELFNLKTKESIPIQQYTEGNYKNVRIAKGCCHLMGIWEKDWSEKGTYKVILIDAEIGWRKHAVYVLNNNNEVEIKSY